uniref:Rootletin-like coiled-coil domain-containing protein n=1 Tax=Latimeria chalumnae TaxID=7897 RepID=H2ZRN8_LATCH
MDPLKKLWEENRLLRQDLAKMEELLAQSHAERDELAIKYGAVSDRLQRSLKAELGDPSGGGSVPGTLAQQILELRRRLEEDRASYKCKLQGYQEGQQRQALLVQKLQAKVAQYKTRCGELEGHLLKSEHQRTDSRLRWREGEEAQNLENVLIRLEEEQQR